MEGFNPKSQQENTKSLEIKKAVEKANEKIRFALKVLFVSAASLLPSESYAQNTENFSSKTETKTQIEWQTDFTEKEKNKIEKEINSQKEWLEEYIKSQKFSERLTKEYILLKEMGGESAIPNFESFIENNIFLKYVVNKHGDTIAVVNKINKTSEWKNGHELSSEEFEKIIKENNTLEKLIPKQDPSKASKGVQNLVKKIRLDRLNALNNGPIILVDSIPNTDTNSIGKIYGISYNGGLNNEGKIVDPKILLIKNYYKDIIASIIHELTHRSTEGDDKMNKAIFFLLRNQASSGSDYLNNPTEIHARINELRYLMNKEGLYNAKKDDFTKYHYKYMLNSDKIMENFTIKQLLETLDEEDLIWFMNNHADTNTIMLDTHDYA